MADFTKVVLIVLGLLSLFGGVFQAIDSWQSELSVDEEIDRKLALAEGLRQAADAWHRVTAINSGDLRWLRCI